MDSFNFDRILHFHIIFRHGILRLKMQHIIPALLREYLTEKSPLSKTAGRSGQGYFALIQDEGKCFLSGSLPLPSLMLLAAAAPVNGKLILHQLKSGGKICWYQPLYLAAHKLLLCIKGWLGSSGEHLPLHCLSLALQKHLQN